MAAIVETFVNGSLAAFGVIWGSYLNVVVYRMPKGLSTAVPSSHCPRCSARIHPFDNVPILSWILLRARCRTCRGPISLRYPLVEAAVGAIFVLGFHRFERPLEIFVCWLLACVLLAVALIDYDRRLVPVVLTAALVVGGWVMQPLLHWTRPANALLTSILGAALVLGASKVWHRYRGEAGFGTGDAYVLAMIGAFFGAAQTLRVAVMALAAAAAVALLLALVARISRRFGRRLDTPKSLPMATFLGLAALWIMLFDPRGPGAAALLR